MTENYQLTEMQFRRSLVNKRAEEWQVPPTLSCNNARTASLPQCTWIILNLLHHHSNEANAPRSSFIGNTEIEPSKNSC